MHHLGIMNRPDCISSIVRTAGKEGRAALDALVDWVARSGVEENAR
jgi:hypothetical protein